MALVRFAERASMQLSRMGEADIQALRAVGLQDRAIHDAVQVIGYFNYINRVASCLGVPDEPEWSAR